MRLHHLLLLPALLALHQAAAEPQTTQQYLDQANLYLGKGEFNMALQSYSDAIDRDPSNYLSYFKRAATYLTLGRNNQALADFTTILKLKPDFGQALLQRGKIYTKSGEFSKAKEDLLAFYETHKGDAQAQEIPALIESIEAASHAYRLAQDAVAKGQTEECVHILGSAILVSPLYVPFRMQRAECHLARGEVEEAVNDFARATHNAATNPQLMHRLSSMSYYSLYMPEQALAQIKQCISFDPENKLCKGLFRKLKATEKDVAKLTADIENKRWAGVINKAVGGEKSLAKNVEAETAAMETENNAVGKMPKRLLLKIYSAACKAYTENKDSANALKWCTSTLSLDESNVDGLVGRGMAFMLDDKFEEAIKDFTKAQELAGGQDRQIHEKLTRAQRLLKQSQQKDYYKILGVSRSASEREIKKAFRKQALLWHPDTYRGDLTPEEVEKKMAGLNEAYEVLSDPELKARFDNGDDPNDPQSQQNPFGQGFAGNPFFQFQQGGGSPFGQAGGGGFQFNFQF
ncbi:DnaJ homolog subfamily C member 3 [Entomortierella parvispora]|uniref:Tetratricopeptide repeat and J domain-containing co-chaperone DNJ1 n=1 Tax=Entomortierella parvispora TaxID=205924 RepID=A0A9P3LZZ9_9FUNG|nr:DnaJ homolog subfamily C member 3 [Entomortierella parvispora]